MEKGDDFVQELLNEVLKKKVNSFGDNLKKLQEGQEKMDARLDKIDERLLKLENGQKEMKERITVVYDQAVRLTETTDELSRDMYKLTDAIDYFRYEASENKEELFSLKKRIRAM